MGYCISSFQRISSQSLNIDNQDLLNNNFDDNSEELKNLHLCDSPNVNLNFSKSKAPILKKLQKLKKRKQQILKNKIID